MRAQLAVGVRALLVLTVLTGLLFPLAMTAVAEGVWHHTSAGSLIKHDGRVVGSELLGQIFTGDAYFHPRPSAAGPVASGSLSQTADPRDLSLAASGATNLGPNNPQLLAAVRDRVASYRRLNRLKADTAVPVDAVTSSGSGLDPHISVANARLQAARVASARGLKLEEVLGLVSAHTTSRVLGLFGEEGVNVLKLNLALDERSYQRSTGGRLKSGGYRHRGM